MKPPAASRTTTSDTVLCGIAVPEGAKIMRIPSGVVTHDLEQEENHDLPAKLPGAKVGIFRTPLEFHAAAKRAVHPALQRTPLEDDLAVTMAM